MLNFLLTSVVWNTNYENNPENSDGPNFGAAEMRSDRKAVRERLEKEHTMNLLSGVVANDGYHKPGSSKDYYQADAPTLRPDGVTALTADDNGRKWVRSTDKRLYVYVHPDWVALSTINANDNTLSGDNIFSGDNTFSGDNIFNGTNTFNDTTTFSGDVVGIGVIDADSPIYPRLKIRYRVYTVTIASGSYSKGITHGIPNLVHRVLDVRSRFSQTVSSVDYAFFSEGSSQTYQMQNITISPTHITCNRALASTTGTFQVFVVYTE